MSIIRGGGRWADYRQPAFVSTTARPPAHFEPGAAPAGRPVFTLLDYWQAIYRRKLGIVGAAALCGILAYFVSAKQAPVYQARVALEFQAPGDSLFNLRESGSPSLVTDSALESYIQTQIEILKDPSTVSRVVDRLGLDKLPQASKTGRLDGVRRLLGMRTKSEVEPKARALDTALAALRIRSAPQTRIVTITYDSTDPALAAKFVNTLSDEFIQQNLDTRWKATQTIGAWLQTQMRDLKSRLEQSEGDLQSYGRASGLLFTQEKDSVAEARLHQLQQELSAAQADRVAKQSQYDMANSSRPEWLPQALQSAPLRDYEVKLTDLRRQAAELGAILTPENYKVQRVNAQIEELEKARNAELAAIQKRVYNEYAAAVKREQAVSAEYGRQAALVTDQAAKSIHYNTLKREVDTAREFHIEMSHKLEEAGIASAIRATNMRVLAPATPPLQPYKPNIVLSSCLGLFAGLCGSVMFAILRAHGDSTIRSRGETASLLNIRELGAVPRAAALTDRSGVLDLSRTLRGLGGARAGEPDWDRGPLILTESVRDALTSLLSGADYVRKPKSIVFTSAGPSEGKTTMASNFAIALAEIGRRVLLIDGDMRRPLLDKIFVIERNSGLSDLLQAERIDADTLADRVKPTHLSNLSVLTAGSETDNAARLLHSERLGEIIRSARSQFDMVLIDAPPVLALSDARLLARAADGAVLVVRAGVTESAAAFSAAQTLVADDVPVLGAVLNDWDPRADGAWKTQYHYYQGLQAKS